MEGEGGGGDVLAGFARRGLPGLGRLAAALALLLAACGPGPRVPAQVGPAPDPFVRMPYLQLLDGRTAAVRWRVEGRPEVGLTYRAGPDTAWRAASVSSGERGDRLAVLEGLPADAEVAYRVRAGTLSVGPHRFRTPPPDSTEATVEVLAFGDSGWGSPAQVRLAALMEDRSWDLALHVGDVAYDDGTEEDLTLRHFRVYAPLLATTPFFPVPGNHDVRTEGGAPFDRAFVGPEALGRRRYGTFRWGGVRFVGLDTSSEGAREALEERSGAQYRWLGGTLAEAARDTTVRWTVLFTHYPLYSHAVGLAGHGPSEELREAIEPLLLEHGVDLVLAGHDHHYERSRPLREGRPVADGCGPVHLVIGGGGASRYARSVAPDVHVARIRRDHHFLALTIRPDSVAGEAIGVEGRTIDAFRLRPYEPAAATCPG